MMNVTIGCELEGGLADEHGQPADSLAVLGGGIKSETHPYETLTTDLGASSLELVTSVCSNGAEVKRSFERCLARMPGGFSPRFAVRPFGSEMPVANKTRYKMIAQSLLREHPRGDRCIHTVAPWCSTQYHVNVPDVTSNESVLLLNFLNNIAPFARLQVIQRYRVDDTRGHLDIWQGWCRPERAPGPRWFADGQEMVRYFTSLPKVVELSEGDWTVANGFSKLGDLASEGTVWWLVRPRGLYRTVEWRPFPSLSPAQAAELADEVVNLVRAFWEYVEKHPRAQWRTKEAAVGLYRHLFRSQLVPVEPLTEDRWWKLSRH